MVREAGAFLEMLQAERGASRNTVLAYSADLKDLCAFLARRKQGPLDADTDALRAYLKSLDYVGMTPRTVARRLSVTRQFFRFLLAEQMRADDPSSALDSPKLGRPLPKGMTRADVEKLIEAARAVGHRRLATLYVMASQCYNTGHVDDAIRFADAGQSAIESGSGEVPFGFEGMLGTVYITVGQPQRWVEQCRALLEIGRDTHTYTRACLVFALIIAGRGDEAMAATNGLVDAAQVTGNPSAVANALLAYGFAFTGEHGLDQRIWQVSQT